MAAYAFCELAMMRAQTPQQLDAALRWGQVPLSIGLLSLVWFVSIYLDAGRRWLAWTICGLRALFVLPNLLIGGNPSFREISDPQHIQLLGESVTVPSGTPDPWGVLGLFALVLILVFVADASLAAWRRGERRKALIIGGSVEFLLIAGFATTVLWIWAGSGCRWPTACTYQVVVGVMGFELSRDLLRATQLAHDLQTSEARSLAILRAVPDLMFLQTADGVYLRLPRTRSSPASRSS